MPKSSAPFAATLVIDAVPSRALTACVAGLYALAAVGLLWLPPVWAALGAAAGAVAAGRDLQRVRRPVHLVWRGDGVWRAGDTGEGTDWQLCAPTYFSRWLVVIVLADERGRVRRYALTRLGVHPTTWRRLRARLRVEGPARAASIQGWRVPASDTGRR